MTTTTKPAAVEHKGYAEALRDSARMLETLWRIAGSDPANSQFATLVLAEVRDCIEEVTGERPPVLGAAS